MTEKQPFTMLQHQFDDSPEFWQLSVIALKLFLLIKRRANGNKQESWVTVGDGVKYLGTKSDSAIRKGLRELVSKGFIIESSKYIPGRKCRGYKVNYEFKSAHDPLNPYEHSGAPNATTAVQKVPASGPEKAAVVETIPSEPLQRYSERRCSGTPNAASKEDQTEQDPLKSSSNAAIDPIGCTGQQTGEVEKQPTSDPVYNPATGLWENPDGSTITSESDSPCFVKQHTEICQKGCGQQVHPARLSNGHWSTVDPDTHKLHQCKQEHIMSYQERLKIKNKLLEYKRLGWIEKKDGTKRQWVFFVNEVYCTPVNDRDFWYDIIAEIEGWKRSNRKPSTSVKPSSDISDDQANGESPEMEEEPH